MSFREAMYRILQPIYSVSDGKLYVPNDYSGYVRNDEVSFHGGVDFHYYNSDLTPLRDGEGTLPSELYPNTSKEGQPQPILYSPVDGQVLYKGAKEGSLYILDENGYVHTIRHMNWDSLTREFVSTYVEAGETPIGRMQGRDDYDDDGIAYHVHYEVSTFFRDEKWGIESKEHRFDPVFFWNSDGKWLVGASVQSNVFYGTQNNEVLIGEADPVKGGAGSSTDNDLLCGGGGVDIINGGGGNDTLFGGFSDGENEYYSLVNGVLSYASNDTDTSTDYLIGGDGEDTLEGGKGDDKLYGGIASIKDDGEVEYNANDDTDTFKDTLKGGEGYDTYYVAKKDVIEDSDGKGIVYLKGNDNALTEARRKKGEVDFKDDYGRKYTLNGSTLTVEGHLKIEKFQNGDLGIWLFEEEEDEKGNIKYTPVKTDFDRAKLNLSPIVLDLDGDGVQTLGLKDYVFFDHDGNGFAERTGWVETGDGLLVRDLDGNGKIETGAELFGNNTLLKNGQMAANGYEAMTDLDDNFDGKIDQNDAAWNELRIWQDINSDGLSQAGELKTLGELRIQSLNVEYIDINLTDVKKNEHRQESTFTRMDGISGSTTGTTEDVWFDVDLINSKPVNRLDVSDPIKELPEIKGMGNVAGLWQTLAREEANGSNQLKTLLEQFIQTDVTDQNTLSNLTRQIIYAWTGVEDKDPASRGYWIGDARVIYALETLVAEPFVNKNYGTEGPYSGAAYNLNYAFNQFAATVQAQLMQQAQFEAYYDAITYSLDENHNVIRDLTAVVPLLTAELEANHELGKKKLVLFIANFMQTNGTDNVDAQAFNTAFVPYGQDVVLVAQMAWQKKIVIADYYNPLIGDDSDEIISALDANDEIGGGGGNDRLYGGRGDDSLYGEKGNDLLFCPMPNANLQYFVSKAPYKIMTSGNIKTNAANLNQFRSVA